MAQVRLFVAGLVLLVLACVAVQNVVGTCPGGPYYPDTLNSFNGTTYFLNAYRVWKERYVVKATVGSRVQDPTDCHLPGRTVSEGIGYGLILSVFANDQTTFESLLSFYNWFLSTKGCMPFLIRPDSTIPPSGIQCAVDADQDVAFALFVASYKFTTRNAVYYQTALKLINKIYLNNVDPQTKILVPFSGTTPGDVLNPSYFATAYYRIFTLQDRNVSHDWKGVAQKASDLLDVIRSANSNTSLVPDWSNKNGAPASATYSSTQTIALKGVYKTGQQNTNVITPAPSIRPTEWPFRFQFMSTAPMNYTYFQLTQVNVTGSTAVDGSAVAVWIQCTANKWLKAANTTIGLISKVFYFRKDACTYPTSDGIFNTAAITIRVYTSKLTVYDFKNVDSSAASIPCVQNKDSHPFYYGYDAVRYPWRTAIDAVYFGNSNSVRRCQALVQKTFASASYLDGEKFLSGSPVYNSDYGYVFKGPAAACHLLNSNVNSRKAIYAALKAGTPANILPDKTYYGDSLHTLSYLLTSGAMTTDTCKLINAAKYAIPNPFNYTLATGSAFVTKPPTMSFKNCLRASNNINIAGIDHWSIAAQFSDSRVGVFYDVYINCGSASFLTRTPSVDLFTTRYLLTPCTSATGAVQIILKPKQGLTGIIVTINSNISNTAYRCPGQKVAPLYCWNWSTSQYYLSMTSAWTLGTVTAVCYNNNITFPLVAQNSGSYPYQYAGEPPGGCASGSVSLNYNGSRALISSFLATTARCPFYCFDATSGTVNSGYKIIAVFQKNPTNVFIDCGDGSGFQSATLEYYQAYGIPSAGCTASADVTIKYTYGGITNTTNTNYQTASCYAKQDPPGTPAPPPPPPPPVNNLDFVPFCVGTGASRNYLDIRAYARSPNYVAGVKVLCGTKTYTLIQNAESPEIFSNSAAQCTTDNIQVILNYTTLMTNTYGSDVTTTFAANLIVNRCTPLCFQAPTDQYYLGVGISYIAYNATLTCPNSVVSKTVMPISGGGYFTGIAMSDTVNSALYGAMLNSNSACTKVEVYIRNQDQPVGSPAPPKGDAFYTVTGQWWTSLLPFTALPVNNPNRCIR